MGAGIQLCAAVLTEIRSGFCFWSGWLFRIIYGRGNFFGNCIEIWGFQCVLDHIPTELDKASKDDGKASNYTQSNGNADVFIG